MRLRPERPHARDPAEPVVDALVVTPVEGHSGHGEVGACHLGHLGQTGRRRRRDDVARRRFRRVQLPALALEQGAQGARVELCETTWSISTSKAAARCRSAVEKSPTQYAAVPRLPFTTTGTTSAPAIPSSASAHGSTGTLW